MKNFKQSCKGFAKGEQGNAMMIALTVTAILGAGFIGYKSGQEDIFNQFVSVLSSEGNTQVSVQKPAENTGAENPVIAKVNGQDIRREDVVALVNAMPAQMRQIPLPQLYPMALEQAISNKIVDEKAANSGLENDKEVKEQLYQVKQQIVRAKFLENEITARIDDARVKEKYDEYVEIFPDIQEVKAAHILVEDEKTAKDVIAKLNKGEDFAALAKEFSQDGSAQSGGDLGYFAKQEVVPAFAEAAFGAEVGSYTKKPVKSDFGYHVIRVDEKRKRAPQPLEEVEENLKQQLQREAFNEIMEDWQSTAKIERFDVDGNPIPSAEEQQAEAESVDEDATEPASGEEHDHEHSDEDDAVDHSAE